MKIFISISLSALLLMQSFNFGATDVIRLGELVEHAQLHSEEYGDSFLDFLTKHYGSLRSDHFSSHEGHEKLPLNHDSGPKSTISVFVFEHEEILVIPDFPTTHSSLNSFYTNTYSSKAGHKIFQPPRQA